MSKTTSAGPARRRVIGCDVGLLGSAAEAAARAQGVNLSAWLRQAIRKALPDEAPEPKPAPASTLRLPREHRAWLTAEDRRKLEAVARHLGLRSRTAALRLLIARAHVDGHADPLTAVDDGLAVLPAAPAGPGAPGPATPAGTPAGAAVDALCRSNAQLTDLARSLHRLARSLEVQPGHGSAADRWLIERAERDIRAHLQQAASLVARLESLVPPPQPVPPTRRAAR